MAKKIGLLFGIVFVLVALLGFMGTGIVGDMGVFHTDMMHNVVHLIVGLVFIFVALKAADSMGMTMKIFGAIYLILAVLGFLMVGSGTGSLLGLIEINGADNYLHLVLGIVILFFGMKAGKGSSMSSSSMGGM